MTLLCPCGVTLDGDVHRVGCRVYLSDPRVRGPLKCSNCGGMVGHLVNDRCGVCEYWRTTDSIRPNGWRWQANGSPHPPSEERK